MTKEEILSKIKGKYLYRERSNLKYIDITCLGKIIDIKNGNYSHPFKVISHVPSDEHPLKFVCFNEKECVNLINEYETLKGKWKEGILEDCWHRYYLRYDTKGITIPDKGQKNMENQVQSVKCIS